MNRLKSALLGIIYAWSILFFGYIAVVFYSQPIWEWKTVSDYTFEPRTVLMMIHWIGGSIVLLLGPLQYIDKIRLKNREIHKWIGRIYLGLGCIPTSICGIIYTIWCGTVGGIVMDVAFVLYGSIFLICGIMTYVYIRLKDKHRHKQWAMRTFSTGIGSAIYRVYILPLILQSVLGVEIVKTREDEILWLNISAYLLFLPTIINEIYIWTRKTQKILYIQ